MINTFAITLNQNPTNHIMIHKLSIIYQTLWIIIFLKFFHTYSQHLVKKYEDNLYYNHHRSIPQYPGYLLIYTHSISDFIYYNLFTYTLIPYKLSHSLSKIVSLGVMATTAYLWRTLYTSMQNIPNMILMHHSKIN